MGMDPQYHYSKRQRSFLDFLADNQKTLSLWVILILVSTLGIMFLFSLFKPGDGASLAQSSPSPSGDNLSILGAQTAATGQVVPPKPQQQQSFNLPKPTASPKPTPKPSPSSTSTPSPSPTSSPTLSPTSSPTETPTSTPAPSPSESPSPSPSPSPNPTP